MKYISFSSIVLTWLECIKRRKLRSGVLRRRVLSKFRYGMIFLSQNSLGGMIKHGVAGMAILMAGRNQSCDKLT